MKRKEFRTYYNSKAMELIEKIEKAEGLETLDINLERTALGDTLIVVSGETEEVKDLEQIFEMVY